MFLLQHRGFRLWSLILLQLLWSISSWAWIPCSSSLTPRGVRQASRTDHYCSIPLLRLQQHQQQQQHVTTTSVMNAENDDNTSLTKDTTVQAATSISKTPSQSRRAFVSGAAATVTATILSSSTSSSTSFSLLQPQPANAIGPVKIELANPVYTATVCPKDRPIPGEKAMKGMRGLCVTVEADLADQPEKPLSKVGVYGFVTDVESGESVLANNPDFGTDAGQFAMIESITPDDRKISFEFIAAVPMEKDISKYENGIGPLQFESLKIISFPGGQQFGAISPCEMNEFSDECEAWEAENGPFERGEYMVRPNSRTKGR